MKLTTKKIEYEIREWRGKLIAVRHSTNKSYIDVWANSYSQGEPIFSITLPQAKELLKALQEILK